MCVSEIVPAKNLYPVPTNTLTLHTTKIPISIRVRVNRALFFFFFFLTPISGVMVMTRFGVRVRVNPRISKLHPNHLCLSLISNHKIKNNLEQAASGKTSTPPAHITILAFVRRYVAGLAQTAEIRGC